MKSILFRWLSMFSLWLFLCWVNGANGQHALRSVPVRITMLQGLNFGTFTLIPPGDGYVIVEWDGRRSATGNIVLLPTSPLSHPAIFEVSMVPGRPLSISYPEQINIIGSGGEVLVLRPGPTDHGGNTMRAAHAGDTDAVWQVRIGGTLFIPAHISPGLFTGRFEVSLHQE